MFVANNKFDFLKLSLKDVAEQDEEDDDDDDEDDIEKDIQTIPKEFLKNCAENLIVPNGLVKEISVISNLRILKSNDHIIALQTIIRDRWTVCQLCFFPSSKLSLFSVDSNSPRDIFVFNSDRLVSFFLFQFVNFEN